MKNFYPGLLQLSCSIEAAVMIGHRLHIDSSVRKAIHFPRFAEKATGPAVLRTFTLVMCHGLRSRACHFHGVAAPAPFFGPVYSVFLALYAMNCRASPF